MCSVQRTRWRMKCTSRKGTSRGRLPLQAALAADSPQDSWIGRFTTSYHAAEDLTAFALVVRAAEERTADMFPHTLFGAARFLLLRLLQVSGDRYHALPKLRASITSACAA